MTCRQPRRRLLILDSGLHYVHSDDLCRSSISITFYSQTDCCQSIVGQGIVVPEVHYGAGRHLGHVPDEDYQYGLKLNFISQPIYLWAPYFIKMSVGLFLLRIAATRGFRRIIVFIMGKYHHVSPR